MIDIKNSDVIGLDFETYGSVDLTKHGLDRYVKDEHFEVLIGGVARYSQGGLRTTAFDFARSKARGYNVPSFYDLFQQFKKIVESASYIVCHNAGFEIASLESMGISLPSHRFIDSAVLARVAGAGGSLEAAAPQLLQADKIEEGKNYIKIFSVPGELQEANGSLAFDPQIVLDRPTDWDNFKHYCLMDASLGLRLASHVSTRERLTEDELSYANITLQMNETGWPVDVDLVKEMHRRYLENLEDVEDMFRFHTGAQDLNLNSGPQLKAWCEARGIRAKSFDEKNVASLLNRINKRLNEPSKLTDDQFTNYLQVKQLLTTKQALGGSSLKKLKVILDTVSDDGRLRDQYIHSGAGQTLRTTGRSVQMQNLKRLGANPPDVNSLRDPDVYWDNDLLAANLRQLFTSGHPNGALVVGDFASVESRGLAWLADERWKLEAYRAGRDVYKDLAAKIFGVQPDEITKAQRQTGKVGELSCGYGAGAGAVQSFAEGMGVPMIEPEAALLVSDWRTANPNIVKFWKDLDEMLSELLSLSRPGGYRQVHHNLSDGFSLVGQFVKAPPSLEAEYGVTNSLQLMILDAQDKPVLIRVFHGIYRRGREICYHKPSMRKTGKVWRDKFIDPKTKQERRYTIYGGKLAGILTQSLCRELFFQTLLRVSRWVGSIDNVDLVGQFHDEIVLDWRPARKDDQLALDLATTKSMLKHFMKQSHGFTTFPMAAEVNSDYRYIK